MFIETCVAPINIAVIKYWGKRNEDLILPVNDSFSMTLSTDEICTTTTIAASSDFKKNRIWLNGREELFEDNIRIKRCVDQIKNLVKESGKLKFPLDWNLHISSKNNFPTAAGLASSAAGYACFVYTLAELYGLKDHELSSIARLGSGSACRSIYGGFVQWKKGKCSDGSDSIAVQIYPKSHWPEMRVLILVVNDNKKKIGSTKGMQATVNTSELLKYRTNVCVPRQIEEIKNAIKEKDFQKFGEITMKDSNQFHAVCLDTFPPCVYMNDISHAIIDFVHKYNELHNKIKVAYTFDAGPNACLYLLESEVPNFLSVLNKVFPNDNFSNKYFRGIPIDIQNLSVIDDKMNYTKIGNNLLKYIIYTKIGEGPKKLSNIDSLLNEAGLPK